MSGSSELTEAEALFQVETGAPDDVRKALRIHGERIGGGVVVSMGDDPTNYWSKALGFGFAEPVTAELVSRVCDVYREQRPKIAVLQFAPSVLPDDWDDIAAANGISAGRSWYKLEHDLSAVPERATELRIDAVGVDDAQEWATLLMTTMGMPPEGLADMYVPTVGRPGFHAYAAWDGTEMVAAAHLFVHGRSAQLCGAATKPSHRNRGAQTALVARRLADAAAAGCTVAFAETGQGTPGEPHPSLDNLRTAGFTVLYERRNWLWRP